MFALHPLQRRLLAEEFVRLRRADEQRRYAASLRRGRIDPNPHQIDAVIFALRRIPEGGCILADEVGELADAEKRERPVRAMLRIRPHTAQACRLTASPNGRRATGENAMDLYEEEQLAIEKAAAAAELRMAMEEGVARGWLYAVDDASGERRYGLTEEGKRAMERGKLG